MIKINKISNNIDMKTVIFINENNTRLNKNNYYKKVPLF